MDTNLLNLLFRHNACSRFADLTGFTPLNLPVWACIRPNAKSGSSSVGKGLLDEVSQLSALFECYELACAERLEADETHEISECHSRFMFYPSLLVSTKRIRVCMGKTLFSNEEVLIPFEYLSMDTTSPNQSYLCSTIGTGAGYTPDQAVCSAIREFIERYSIYVSQFEQVTTSRISIQSCDFDQDPSLLHLIHHCLENQCEILVQDLTRIDNWPCFSVRLFCRQTHHLMVGNGYGCGQNPALALIQAILEAHQGLCVGVSGMRDDMVKATYLSSRSDHCKWDRDLRVKYPLASLKDFLENNRNWILVDERSFLEKIVMFEYPVLETNQPYACFKALLPQ